MFETAKTGDKIILTKYRNGDDYRRNKAYGKFIAYGKRNLTNSIKEFFINSYYKIVLKVGK